ncbi:hypothetical protein BH09CHL1_BH09CHL1_00490 [soil metagenome]
MHSRRFAFALEQLKSEHWQAFERLASAFLADEFASLRTTAHQSGDGGRDSELFSPLGYTNVVIQYSVTADWKAKIRSTAELVKAKFPNVIMLIYATNQLIGSKADQIKTDIREKFGLILDVRDQNWFIERVNQSRAREAAADELTALVVDPLLPTLGQSINSVEMTSSESRAALLFLEMAWEDESREKGLTKLSYEALVMSSLRDTMSENRMSREEVYLRVKSVLSDQPENRVRDLTDSALNRVCKKTDPVRVRHWRKEDEFCLSFEERARIEKRLKDADLALFEFQTELKSLASRALGKQVDEIATGIAIRSLRVFNSLFVSRGEDFASGLMTGVYERISQDDLRSIIVADLAEFPEGPASGAECIGATEFVVLESLSSPSEATTQYLRALSDSYTLLAFLRQTKDVQSVISKMFFQGDIWLDTNLVLPLFGELLSDGNGQLTVTFRVAIEAGLKLHVTPGVIEEVSSHFDRCLQFYRRGGSNWIGNAPYLVSQYVESGRSIESLKSWLENFRGDSRPIEDISEFLGEAMGITTIDLAEDARQSEPQMRNEVMAYWQRRHEEKRLARAMPLDEMVAMRMANHDVENYLGVYQRRKVESKSPFGYTSWWVTFDQGAVAVDRVLRDQLRVPGFYTPVMSPDFLVSYLAIGPIRSKIDKNTERLLPAILSLRLTNDLPPDVIDFAENVRKGLVDVDERVVRRKVRDEVDKLKSRKGSLTLDTLSKLNDDELVN